MTTTMPEGYQLDPRNIFLAAAQLRDRYGCGRTVGYQCTGQYRGTGISWEAAFGGVARLARQVASQREA